MYTALTIVLALVTITAHEVAHTIAIRRQGLRIHSVGLGIPWGPRLTWQPKRLSFPIIISPLITYAYVRLDPDDQEHLIRLPYREASEIYGAGIMVNILFTAAATGLRTTIKLLDPSSPARTRDMVMLAASVVGSLLIWKFRSSFCCFAIPLLGLIMTGAVIYAFLNPGFGGSTSSLLDLVTADNLTDALGLAAGTSLLLGLLNATPFIPMDGGLIANQIIKRWHPSLVKNWTRVSASLFVIYLVYPYVMRLVR